jgi:lipoprotein-anchoring transpeptidase ErfK/SrfK
VVKAAAELAGATNGVSEFCCRVFLAATLPGRFGVSVLFPVAEFQQQQHPRRYMMKGARALLIVVSILLTAFVVPSIVWADDSALQTGIVNVGGSFVWVRSGPGTTYQAVGRLARGATVTILEQVSGQAVYGGRALWYRLGDSRYVYADLVRLTSVAALPTPTPRSAPASAGKWIEVILSQHTLIAWEGNSQALTTIVTLGKPSTPTVKGTFRIYATYKSKTMSGSGYSLPNVPNIMFFYGGYAIHGTYWHESWGQNLSHGCVNVNLTDAAWLFDWTPMGTKVVVHN